MINTTEFNSEQSQQQQEPGSAPPPSSPYECLVDTPAHTTQNATRTTTIRTYLLVKNFKQERGGDGTEQPQQLC